MGKRRSWVALAQLAGALIVSGGSSSARADQTWRDKRLYFGDAHWHSCLSQDAGTATLGGQYESMIIDYGLDFSLQSEHAEGAEAGITECAPYLPLSPLSYSGETIANAMKQAADDHTGELVTTSGDTVQFVAFPGYEWAPDSRCWTSDPLGSDSNAGNDTPGHINYFFNGTSGWTYHDDVWAPGDGPSSLCAIGTGVGAGYYNGSKDWTDEILGQLIHQRDDPERAYDLFIQYNHPAASTDKGGETNHLAKWFDLEHSSTQCDVVQGGTACVQNQCETMRRAYGVTGVEWYARQEASIGSTQMHGDVGFPCTGNPAVDQFSPRCFHDQVHIPARFVTSRALREGYLLSETGGSDNHGGRRFAPDGDFPGSRGAGSGSLTVVQAGAATRPSIWEGLSRRRTYALSRLREIGPVHKGRVDFFSTEPSSDITTGHSGSVSFERGMGELVEADPGGSLREFTISAAAEEGSAGVYPLELRLYRVRTATALTTATDFPFWWLDDVPNDPGKLGELVGIVQNPDGSPELTHTFTIGVAPGDAIFAVVPYSDYVWVDDFYSGDETALDADGDGLIDPGKSGFLHNNNNTWARTTPIFVRAADEHAQVSPACARIAFQGSGTESLAADGGGDGGIWGDLDVLPVADPNLHEQEWNRWHFTVPDDYEYIDLGFLTEMDEDQIGHLFAVRIDGQLVYSGRAGIDHAVDTLTDIQNIPFLTTRGLHLLEVHMDDQEFADGDNDPDFHCDDYDGPPAFVDAVTFKHSVAATCFDMDPPFITCPVSIGQQCSTFGGTTASEPAVAQFLAGAVASDYVDPAPVITHDAPQLFPLGTTTVTFTATDSAGWTASCQAALYVGDTEPPVVSSFQLTPTLLSPVNQQLRSISVPTVVAADVCDPEPVITCSVTSSEAPVGLGDNTLFDIVFDDEEIFTQGTGFRKIHSASGEGTFSLSLRAERQNYFLARTYKTTCTATDDAGNGSAPKVSNVKVPGMPLPGGPLF
ncbi:MAG: HYR domain-containing protein [Polyangiaceae bacterium]|nr:HYR domain-containing protein [Polyangiaceae bacterium]